MRTAGLAIVTVLAFAGLVVAQQTRVDFAISGAAVFSKTTSSSNGSVSDTPTKSVAYIGTARYHIAPKHAIEINFGHTRNSQIFSVAQNSYRVISGITEFTADYVFQPSSIWKFAPFVFAGAGGLRFTPGNTYINTFPATLNAAQQTSLTFLYGGGADYALWRILALRFEYRGLLYKEPDFNLPTLFFTGGRAHMGEPSAGIVVKF
jgi:opacity protein-like surface antigen